MSKQRNIPGITNPDPEHQQSPGGIDGALRDLIRLLARHAAQDWLEQSPQSTDMEPDHGHQDT